MRIFAFCFLITISAICFSQDQTITEDLTRSTLNTQSEQYYENIGRTLNIVVHSFTGDSLPQSVVDIANYYFEPIGIQFSICEEHFHSYIFGDSLKGPDNAGEHCIFDTLSHVFYEQNIINVYLVKNIYLKEAGEYEQFGGFARLSGAGFHGKQVFLAQPSALTHELGHFFGLQHPHDTGESLSDTPKEPRMDKDIIYTGCQVDYNKMQEEGQLHLVSGYSPSVTNIMSYIGGCAVTFTKQQYELMVQTYYKFHTDLR